MVPAPVIDASTRQAGGHSPFSGPGRGAWRIPLDFYRSLVELDYLEPSNDAPAMAPDSSDFPAADWIYRTALVLDLDQTLIRPSPAMGQRPSAFPLSSHEEIEVESQMGRRYQVREGLQVLGRILDLPWRNQVLLSRAPQSKVTEVARKLRVGGHRLEDRMDACVGSELLQVFANRQGLRLPFHSTPCLGNPNGRPAKAKPAGFILLRDMRDIGAALRQGELSRAASIVGRSEMSAGCSLILDDQPFYEPLMDGQAFCQVIPYTRVENFRALCAPANLPSPIQFNYLDFLWRAGASPFGYLYHLLRKNLSWADFLQRRHLESDLSEALARRVRWPALCRRYALEDYLEYAAGRRGTDEGLLASRHAEHVRVYRTLRDAILEDARRGWNVLLLGRDMDYVFAAVREAGPEWVRSARIISLPLSRVSIAQMSDEVLSRLILTSLGPRGAASRGLIIYDVGYHGTIPSRIKAALRGRAWRQIPRVEVRLLNICDCPVSDPAQHARVVPFRDWEGEYVVSRELGISIERCPHRKGRLEAVHCRGRQFTFEHAPHPPGEARNARLVQQRILSLLRKPAMGTHIAPEVLRLVAKRALDGILSRNPRFTRRLRSAWQTVYEWGNGSSARSIRAAIYPYSGINFLTPLLCFRELEHLVLIDGAPDRIAWSDLEVDVNDAAAWLTDVAAGYDGEPGVMRRSLLEILERGPGSPASRRQMQLTALLAAPLLLSFASLIPRVKLEQLSLNGSRKDASLSGVLHVESRTAIRFEYFPISGSLSARTRDDRCDRLLRTVPTALVLPRMCTRADENALPLQRWADSARMILLEEPLISAPYTGEPAVVQSVKCVDFVAGPSFGEDERKGACSFRIMRREPPLSPPDAPDTGPRLPDRLRSGAFPDNGACMPDSRSHRVAAPAGALEVTR